MKHAVILLDTFFCLSLCLGCDKSAASGIDSGSIDSGIGARDGWVSPPSNQNRDGAVRIDRIDSESPMGDSAIVGIDRDITPIDVETGVQDVGVSSKDAQADGNNTVVSPDTGTSSGDTGTSSSCFNGIQDRDETGVDCGGSCASCTNDYALAPPHECWDQFWVEGCQEGNSSTACEGRCNTANACFPPEGDNKINLPKAFACPRWMLFSPEMEMAVKDDTVNNRWGNRDDPPFNYAVVGHDPDSSGVDQGLNQGTCCQCYQLVFEAGEQPGSDIPPPKPLIVQSFNTQAGGPKAFDVFMGAGGLGAFNACYDDPAIANTSRGGEFLFDSYPSEADGTFNGGVKPARYPECQSNGIVTTTSLQSQFCRSLIEQRCAQINSNRSELVTRTARSSCLRSNLSESFYHQNWTVRAKRVECPTALKRVTGCALESQGLPAADPLVQTVAQADATFRSGYHITTMSDCCKPTCAWKDNVNERMEGAYRSFYSCDASGVPITQ